MSTINQTHDLTLWKEAQKLTKQTKYLYVRMKWFPLFSFVHIVNTTTQKQRKMRTLCGYYVDFDTSSNAEMKVLEVSVKCPEGKETINKPCRVCEDAIATLFKQQFLKGGENAGSHT